MPLEMRKPEPAERWVILAAAMTARRLTTIRRILLCATLAGILLGCDASPSSDLATRSPSPSGDGEKAAPKATELAAAKLDAVMRERDDFARARELAELLATLGPEAIPYIRWKLDRSRAGLGGAEFELLVRFWASHDPSAATAWALGLLAPRYRIPAIHTALELWAKSDPVAALTGFKAKEVVHLDSREAAQVALVRGWFQTDRAGVEEYIRKLEPNPGRDQAILAYVTALMLAEGSDGVIRWAAAVPAGDESYKSSVYFYVASVLSAYDPPAAERWCEAHCEGPYGRGMRAGIVMSRLDMGDDGGSVVEWVARGPQGQNRDQLLVGAYQLWASGDREAALGWMQQKTEKNAEPWVSKLYGPYALHLAATSPAEAIQWAGRVEGDSAREELLVQIAQLWRRQDEKAAEAWLVESPLSEQARERARNADLLEAFPRGPGH